MASSSTHDEATSSMDTEDSSEELFPGCTSVTEFSQKMLRTVVQATKTSNDLPTGDDYDFYSTFDNVRNVLDMEARRLLQLLQSMMRHQNIKGNITGTDHALELDEQFDVIMDANDQILERVGTWVDEATGVKKNDHKLVVSAVTRPNPAVVASWNKKRSSTGSPSAPLQLLTAKNIQRPQLSFRDKIDNSNKPFTPILRRKPHAKKSLQESLQLPPGVTLDDTENPDFVYPHPYKYELDEWQPTAEQLEKVTPQEPKAVDDTDVQFIDAVSDLAELCDLLKKEKEIAVDLEHHSYRTFQGFVCLMQVSTRSQDFLIDTLALRSDMQMLNEVFTHPDITKVFHGADSDIEWLQRDFGLYVVNMFDTGQAARVLNSARFSLAHLLQVYCQVEADKQYQLSDWRMRPLHEKMMRYAQEDTHYLLYIYDRMRCELIDRGNEQKNLLQSVYQRSKNLCLKVYKKVRLTRDSHLDLYMKSKKVFNSQQLQALKDIYAWRDKVAREEDESMQYVLPNHMLLQMAEILPRERQGVLACCNPIPPLVRQCQHEVHSLIMQARDTTLLQETETKRVMEPSPSQHPLYHTSITTCPHDISKVNAEVTADVDMLDADSLSKQTRDSPFWQKINIALKNRPALSALESSLNTENGDKTSSASKIQQAFVNPFLLFLPTAETPNAGSILKPQTTQKTWRLKQHTPVASLKRKSDVDLNTFAPEFAPPSKRHNAQSVATPNSKSPSCGLQQSPANQTAASASPMTTGQSVIPQSEKSGERGEGEEMSPKRRVVLSSREMTKKKKKEKKALKKAAISNTPSIPQPSASAPGSNPNSENSFAPSSQKPLTDGKKNKKKQMVAETEISSDKVTEKKKKKKLKIAVDDSEISSTKETGLVSSANETEKKKKKNSENLNPESSSTKGTELEVSSVAKGGEKKKKKKDKLKKIQSELATSSPIDSGEKEKKKKKGKSSLAEPVEEEPEKIKKKKKKEATSAQDEATEEKSEKKKKKKKTDEENILGVTESGVTEEEGEKKKKKKKTDEENILGVAESGVTEEEGEKKKKKKKKKMKMNTEAVEDSIKPFDYSSADKSTVTGKGKKKIHADVYNPTFRGGAKNQKKGKKERFGAKQRKSITFKP